MSETVKRSGASIPAALIGLLGICAVLVAFLYLCDWLVQPNTPEQMCAEVVAEAFNGEPSATVSVSGSARVDATSVGDISAAYSRKDAFEACLARYPSGGAYRTRQGWWR